MVKKKSVGTAVNHLDYCVYFINLNKFVSNRDFLKKIKKLLHVPLIK